MIEDINKQRDCNKLLKLKVQSDIGELRRIYQVTGHRAEHPEGEGVSQSAAEGEGEGEVEGKGMGERMGDTEQRQAQSADLTMQLYRNRQRLMALRSAVQELENKALSMSFSVPVLPPIEGSVSIDDVKATSVFMTARVPLHTAVLSTLDVESKGGTGERAKEGAGEYAKEGAREKAEEGREKAEEEAEEGGDGEAEAEGEAKEVKEVGEEAMQEGAKVVEEEDRGDLFASLDEEVLSKINDSQTVYHGEVINVHSTMPPLSDL